MPNIFHIECVGMFVIYIHRKLHIQWLIISRGQTGCSVRSTKTALTKYVYISKFCYQKKCYDGSNAGVRDENSASNRLSFVMTFPP